MTIENLREICHNYYIKQGKKKDKYIENILNRVNTIHTNSTELIKLELDIKSKWKKDPSVIHDFYREWFNIIDIADGYWYSVEDNHHTQSWGCKMIHAILRHIMLISWAYHSLSKYESWIDYRTNVGRELTKYSLD